MGKLVRVSIVLAVLAIGLVVATATASAQPFLCPIVGDGVINADAHNGDNGVSAGAAADGTTFIPGNNQAGDHANPHAYNALGPEVPGSGPGHNPDFSPIWPYTPAP